LFKNSKLIKNFKKLLTSNDLVDGISKIDFFLFFFALKNIFKIILIKKIDFSLCFMGGVLDFEFFVFEKS